MRVCLEYVAQTYTGQKLAFPLALRLLPFAFFFTGTVVPLPCNFNITGKVLFVYSKLTCCCHSTHRDSSLYYNLWLSLRLMPYALRLQIKKTPLILETSLYNFQAFFISAHSSLQYKVSHVVPLSVFPYRSVYPYLCIFHRSYSLSLQEQPAGVE